MHADGGFRLSLLPQPRGLLSAWPRVRASIVNGVVDKISIWPPDRVGYRHRGQTRPPVQHQVWAKPTFCTRDRTQWPRSSPLRACGVSSALLTSCLSHSYNTVLPRVLWRFIGKPSNKVKLIMPLAFGMFCFGRRLQLLATFNLPSKLHCIQRDVGVTITGDWLYMSAGSRQVKRNKKWRFNGSRILVFNSK